MPVDPDVGARRAAVIADAVTELELVLLRTVRDTLTVGINDDGWADRQHHQLRALRTRLLALVGGHTPALLQLVDDVVGSAYAAGQALGAADVEDLDLTPGHTVDPASRVGVLVRETRGRLTVALSDAAHRVAAVYAEAVNTGAAEVLGGRVVRVAATQHVLDRLAVTGVRGFRDTAGRNWALTSYAEMAVRTVSGQAAVQGHTDRLQAAGVDLVIVSDAPRECPLCRPFEGKVLSLGRESGTVTVPSLTGGKPVTVTVAATLDQAKRAGFQHPNCFPGEVLVSAPSGVNAADARWYEGPLTVIRTASGDELPVTPNHPILTPEGWVAAGALQVGQDVLRYGSRIGPESVPGPHNQEVPARISDVVDALGQAGTVTAVRVPVASEQFHGDGTLDTEVEVVLADRLLQYDPATSRFEERADSPLLVGGMGSGPFLPESASLQVRCGPGHAPDRIVCGTSQGGPFGRFHACETTAHGFGPADSGDALTLHSRGEGGLADADGGRRLALVLLAGQVVRDRVTEVSIRRFAGHVYNLQTGDGWYVASGIVVHNCRHSISAYLPGATRQVKARSDPDGYEQVQRQRGMERKVREWKRRGAVALDDEAARHATTKVGEWQAAIREHVDRHDLKRLSRREQIGRAV